ncbi:AAA family ATPase [Streptomyces microflavus]|uniref:AAA family ATPase n=1 Tax=Streptomyces microflavus TaxID=1919 RepID=UPI0037FD3FC3
MPLSELLSPGWCLGVVSYDVHQAHVAGRPGRVVGDHALESARERMSAHCAAGRTVIVDGTHSQRDRRVAIRAIAAAHRYVTAVVALRVPLAVCLERQASRAWPVPAADVTRQDAAITAALPELEQEGHARVVRLPAP